MNNTLKHKTKSNDDLFRKVFSATTTNSTSIWLYDMSSTKQVFNESFLSLWVLLFTLLLL